MNELDRRNPTSLAHTGELGLPGKIALLLAATLALLSTAIVSSAMPDIAAHFSGSFNDEWLPRILSSLAASLFGPPSDDFLIKLFVLSIPALFIVIGAPLVGIISDRLGRQRVLATALTIFAVSGVSGYFAESLTTLIVGRAILGLSVAGITTCTVAMIGDYFKGPQRDRFAGTQGAAMKIGGVTFLLAGGVLADLSWRTPFLIYAISLIALPGVLFFLRDPSTAKSHHSADVEKLHWGRIGFVLISAFSASSFFFMILVQVPFFLDQAFSVTRTQVGLATATANTVAGLIAIAFSLFRSRLTYVGVFAFIFAMIGAGYGVVSIAPSYLLVLGGLAIAGIGIGLIVPTQSAWMLSVVPATRRGMAMGLVATAMYCGQFMAPILIEPFVDPEHPFRIFEIACLSLLGIAALYSAIAMRQPISG